MRFVANLTGLILTLLGEAAIMNEAGYSGWNAIIPFYGSYVFFKIAGKKNLFWVYFVLEIGLYLCVFGIYSSPTWDSVNRYVMLILLLCAGLLIVHILRSIGLADAFMLSGGYLLGLIVLPTIFYLVVGFSSNIRYYGSERRSTVDYPEENGNDYSDRYNSGKDFYDRDF